jgi:hypothetical protein
MPGEIIIESSIDGIDFSPLYKGKELLYIDNLEPQVMEVEPSFTPVKARYIKIKAIQYGKLPSWHEGAGGDSHIFVDEIQIQ